MATIPNCAEFVRRVYANMILFKRENDSANAYVRIGRTGNGIAPNYRIEPDQGYVLALLDDDKDLSRYFVAYKGLGHNKATWGEKELKAQSWSDNHMDLEGVAALLGKLRNFKPKQRS